MTTAVIDSPSRAPDRMTQPELCGYGRVRDIFGYLGLFKYGGEINMQ